MIPYIGNLTLWLSLTFALIQFFNSRKKKNYLTLKINTISINGLLICSFISFAALIYCYLVSDFTVTNVVQNSHTTKPIIYKIAATWGNHEGSMLLWILVLGIYNFFIFKLYNEKNSLLINKALETQALISIGFLCFTIFTSNPFERIFPAEENGLGFNPILQDPALAIHPPLLYFGYVGFSAAFSISIAALSVKNDKEFEWYNYMRPFVIIAWTFLTIGIAFGSFWAYYELGWGGWWFWDPVENASFMPWLIGTALVHSLIIAQKKKYLLSWVLLLGILAFLLSVIGTFLVRSGILTSVHTFALDPSRGIFILIFIALLGGYSLLMLLKSKKYPEIRHFSFLSKEGSILVNNIIMIIVCSSVFLGTTYPLIIETLTNSKISVGEPYYNSVIIPIIIPAILIMGIGPILSWGKDSGYKIFKRILPNIIFTIIVTLIIFLFYKTYSNLGAVGVVLSSWIISNNIILIFKKKISQSKGMIISHLGIGLLILGITGSSVWQEEKIIKMNLNSQTLINDYEVTFKEIKQVKKSNYVALRGIFEVKDKKNKFITNLKPENRFYPITNIFTSEASIYTNLLGDLYIVLGEGNINEGWIVRVYYNPLVIWLWVGAFAIFLGGVFSTINNLKFINFRK